MFFPKVPRYFWDVKNVVIISFVFCMLLKPLYPIAEYIMNYDYIVENLCENKNQPAIDCNGKCYLSKLLGEKNRQAEENPFENRLIIECSQTLFFENSRDILIPSDNFKDSSESIAYLENNNPSKYVEELTPPPEFLA